MACQIRNQNIAVSPAKNLSKLCNVPTQHSNVGVDHWLNYTVEMSIHICHHSTHSVQTQYQKFRLLNAVKINTKKSIWDKNKNQTHTSNSNQWTWRFCNCFDKFMLSCCDSSSSERRSAATTCSTCSMISSTSLDRPYKQGWERYRERHIIDTFVSSMDSFNSCMSILLSADFSGETFPLAVTTPGVCKCVPEATSFCIFKLTSFLLLSSSSAMFSSSSPKSISNIYIQFVNNHEVPHQMWIECVRKPTNKKLIFWSLKISKKNNLSTAASITILI